MNRIYFFWILLIVLLCMLLTFFSMREIAKPRLLPEKALPSPHPISPFKSYISGVGVVEASSNNISIGTPVNRIVNKVLVDVGSEVKKGDVLFTMEDNDLQADLITRQIAYEISLANLHKLESMPREQDVTASQASLRNRQIELDQARSQYERVLDLGDSRALSQQEINRRRYTYEQALSHVEESEAQLNKLKSGTWKPDLTIAKLEVQQAQGNVERVKTDIDRTVVRAPIDGKVLQVKIHEGEYPTVYNMKGPLMILGNTHEMYLKVSINQFDAPYFRSTAPAVAFLRGNARIKFPLAFIHLEPFLVNKQNLTNEITEKVDTRVLQVIYHIKKEEEQNLFVGQQMDVFIETEFPS